MTVLIAIAAILVILYIIGSAISGAERSIKGRSQRDPDHVKVVEQHDTMTGDLLCLRSVSPELLDVIAQSSQQKLSPMKSSPCCAMATGCTPKTAISSASSPYPNHYRRLPR